MKQALKEYHVKGTVNGKPFQAVTDDVYSANDIHKQNPHLSADEAKAIESHTETEEFENGNERTSSVQNGHSVSAHTNGGYFGDHSEFKEKMRGITNESFTNLIINNKMIEAKQLFQQTMQEKLVKAVSEMRKEVAKSMFNTKQK